MATKLTEAAVLELLRKRHDRPGNGGAGEVAFMTGVRNAAGFNANRTFDAVTLHLWPSRGHTIDVFEVKVSRSDWQRELAKPAKAEDACRTADRFWIVAPAGCVRDGELPPTWGLIEVTGDGDDKAWRLRTKHQAPLLTDHGKQPPALSRSIVASMLRSVPGAVPGSRNVSASERQLERARSEGYREGAEAAKAERSAAERMRARHDDDKIAGHDALVAALIDAGLDRHTANLHNLTRRYATAIAAAVCETDLRSRLQPLMDRTREALTLLEGATDATD